MCVCVCVCVCVRARARARVCVHNNVCYCLHFHPPVCLCMYCCDVWWVVYLSFQFDSLSISLPSSRMLHSCCLSSLRFKRSGYVFTSSACLLPAPGALRYRVSAGTGWSGVSIL